MDIVHTPRPDSHDSSQTLFERTLFTFHFHLFPSLASEVLYWHEAELPSRRVFRLHPQPGEMYRG